MKQPSVKKISMSNEDKAVIRAQRSITCLPFKKAFYEQIDQCPISGEELCKRQDWQKLVFVEFGPQRAIEHFVWLIKLGILRREVDGQGLTSRVRLTPMGRKIIRSWDGEIPRAGLRERIIENLRRHRRIL
jgi:hypothetical protein